MMMPSLLQESLVETDDASGIARGNGAAKELVARLASVRVSRFEPLSKSRVVKNPLAPTRDRAVECALNVSILRSLGHTPQLLVLGPQFLKFRPNRIVGSAPSQIDKI
jgi:hypothetical protein